MQRAQSVAKASPEFQQELKAQLVAIPGGFFEMGTRKSRFAQDWDAPRRKVKLSPYLIADTSVTNAQFARFVDETGYSTVAETEGWSIVFHLLLRDLEKYPSSPPGLPWWRQVEGACWHAPYGPGSDLSELEDHPVTHICWFDALAYCTWSGLLLPTEAQWERAARGGLEKKKFPWGNQLHPNGKHMMNIWQGNFPDHNTQADGYLATAPVKSYKPNGYGLYNMCGNVWEWVQNYYEDAPPPKGPLFDPKGPADGVRRIQRGGSFLCHDSYCDRYHVHSRTYNDPDSSTSHSGFRVAALLPH
jgi:formylglycine-generating enzyme required for sulfatase activity